MDNKKIFLVQNPNKTWSAKIADKKPFRLLSNIAELTPEKEYPVEVFYRRTDLNGSSVVEADICPDRNSLLESLNWIGKCGYSILSLWDYEIHRPISADLQAIFDDAYSRSQKLLQAAADDFAECVLEDFEDFDSQHSSAAQKPSLSETIHSAEGKTSSSHTTDKNPFEFER